MAEKTQVPEGVDASDLDLTEVDALTVEQHEDDDVDHDAIPEGFVFEEEGD